MKLSIQNSIVKSSSEFKQLRMIKRAGFKYVDWDLHRYYPNSTYARESLVQCREHYEKLKRKIEKSDIEIYQTHTLFPTYMDAKNEIKMFTGIENCFLATHILGAKYTVVHPMMPKEWEGEEMRQYRIDRNIKFYNEITPLAHKYDIKICIENMFGMGKENGKFAETSCSRYEDMLAIYDGLEDKSSFAFCFDSGHANMIYKDRLDEEILALGDKIKVVHLHDNDSNMDYHNLPHKGNIDWDVVMESLDKVGFDGVYNFELHDTSLPKFFRQHRLNEIHNELEAFLSAYNK